eukprot:COSAG02_NODE_1767_length_11002_cov_41.487205_3_plen_166_part_00
MQGGVDREFISELPGAWKLISQRVILETCAERGQKAFCPLSYSVTCTNESLPRSQVNQTSRHSREARRDLDHLWLGLTLSRLHNSWRIDLHMADRPRIVPRSSVRRPKSTNRRGCRARCRKMRGYYTWSYVDRSPVCSRICFRDSHVVLYNYVDSHRLNEYLSIS